MLEYLITFTIVFSQLEVCHGQVYINTVDKSNWKPFDCARGPFPPCFNQGVCQLDGTCLCNNNRLHHDCRLSSLTWSLVTTNCNVECEHGQCYRRISTGQHACVCDPGYAGPTCKHIRGRLMCGSQSMVFEIFPQPGLAPFNGEMSLQFARSLTLIPNPACQANTRQRAWNGASFAMNISTSEDGQVNMCDTGLEVYPKQNGAATRCYSVRLMYNPLFQANVDEIFTFCCNELVRATSDIITVEIGDDTDPGVQVTGNVNIVRSRLIRKSDGTRIVPTTPLNLGEEISFIIGLRGDTYQDLRVVNCSVPGELILIENRCPTMMARPLVRELSLNNSEVTIDLNAWIPASGNQITIVCDSIVCTTTCGAVTICPDSSLESYGRRRRDTRGANDSLGETDTLEGDEMEVITVKQTFFVGVPFGQQTCPAQEVCATNPAFVPLTAVFGTVLLLQLVVIIFLCFRNHRHNKTREISS